MLHVNNIFPLCINCMFINVHIRREVESFQLIHCFILLYSTVISLPVQPILFNMQILE